MTTHELCGVAHPIGDCPRNAEYGTDPSGARYTAAVHASCGTRHRIGDCPMPDDMPPGATLAPWTDQDDAELADAMADARDRIAARWSAALRGGRAMRAVALDAARLMYHELATAAARHGTVADPEALPIVAVRPESALLARADDPHAARRAEAVARMHETVSVWTTWTSWSRGTAQDHDALIKSHDDFEERTALRTGAADTWPIVLAAR